MEGFHLYDILQPSNHRRADEGRWGQKPSAACRELADRHDDGLDNLGEITTNAMTSAICVLDAFDSTNTAISAVPVPLPS
jgi:hypothetical protein